jgi:hypothetical protein
MSRSIPKLHWLVILIAALAASAMAPQLAMANCTRADNARLSAGHARENFPRRTEARLDSLGRRSY